MGYSHTWYRPAKFNAEKFADFAGDCKKIVDYCEKSLGIDLANGLGEKDSRPEIDFDLVRFNGSDSQRVGRWTTDENISIPWPAPEASLTEENPDPIAQKTNGQWFAGDLVTQRVAPINTETGLGSGSYETFDIGQEEEREEKYMAKTGEGLLFDCTKTAYRPYDLPVTACLIALKHHFPFAVVRTDGQEKDWLDGKVLCNNLLGYGLDFQADKEMPKENPAPEKKPNIAQRPTKKITLSTVKAFLRRNKNLYIRVDSHFNGMIDCVDSCHGGFSACENADLTKKDTFGISGAWFVGGSRDRFGLFDDGEFWGYQVSNCCGSFVLAIRKGG